MDIRANIERERAGAYAEDRYSHQQRALEQEARNGMVAQPQLSVAPLKRRSLLHDASRFPSMETSAPSEQQPRSVESSPSRQQSPEPHSSPSSASGSRRIAPAPMDDDDGDHDDGGGVAVGPGSGRSGGNAGSIRGGRWTADEHERFLEGFRIHGHKWKRVQQVVRTRSVTQVRTHAQKYLLKVAKLKAEKKHGGGKPLDMAALTGDREGGALGSDGEASNTAPSTPERGVGAGSPRKTPRKKVRRLEHGSCDPVDQEYIAAAATTLCFLMSQKIDSLFDTRHESQLDGNSNDLEPYDCYSQQQPMQQQEQNAAASTSVEVSRDPGSGSRKRSYMHFITDQQEDYPSYDPAASHGEPSSYTIEGSKLCS
ncbi:hypothetical protein BBJ28_00008303 [Nothophytophthora sp. Chile5]|nr:hypothetical protein BBJ28_00008303 [Nothophytophthora sp. Chile5]